VAAGIRARVGEDFALLVKINSDDFIEDGFRADEMVRVSKMLEAADVDAVEISGGTGSSGDKIPAGSAFRRPRKRRCTTERRPWISSGW